MTYTLHQAPFQIHLLSWLLKAKPHTKSEFIFQNEHSNSCFYFQWRSTQQRIACESIKRWQNWLRSLWITFCVLRYRVAEQQKWAHNWGKFFQQQQLLIMKMFQLRAIQLTMTGLLTALKNHPANPTANY